jgi:hypothetical protein
MSDDSEKNTIETQKEPETDLEKQETTDPVVESLLEPLSEPDSGSKSDTRISFDQFVDERMLISRDLFGSKEMKIKVLEVSDENPPNKWKLGDRVKLIKILVTIKHLDTQVLEESEFDVEAIEKELTEKRHYTSTNRWVPTIDIKNGYIIGSRHTSIISDAHALDYIDF